MEAERDLRIGVLATGLTTVLPVSYLGANLPHTSRTTTEGAYSLSLSLVIDGVGDCSVMMFGCLPVLCCIFAASGVRLLSESGGELRERFIPIGAIIPWSVGEDLESQWRALGMKTPELKTSWWLIDTMAKGMRRRRCLASGNQMG